MAPPGGRGLAALALAVVLGVSGGAVTAFFAQEDEPVGADPLELGIPLENVDCTGETLMLVAIGDTRAALAPSVRDSDELGVKYLKPAESCTTAYPRREGTTPQYAAYLSYPSLEAACTDRMTNVHKDDFVTLMRAGNTDQVMCPCELDRTTLPEIGEGREPTTESRMWTSMYQWMLVELDRLDLDEIAMGTFDQETIDATRTFQGNNNLNPYGFVDQDTWAAIRDKSCGLFRY